MAGMAANSDELHWGGAGGGAAPLADWLLRPLASVFMAPGAAAAVTVLFVRFCFRLRLVQYPQLLLGVAAFALGAWGTNRLPMAASI